MPMGLKNAPAIHQRQVTTTLCQLIRKFCHIYLDNIVIWSNTIEEHECNVCAVLEALRDARLHVNSYKTHLFCTEIDFLSHHIGVQGIEADNKNSNVFLTGLNRNLLLKSRVSWDWYNILRHSFLQLLITQAY